MRSGLVPKLVMLCRTELGTVGVEVETSARMATLQTRAAAVLRNLAHNQRNHTTLIQVRRTVPLLLASQDRSWGPSAACSMH
jgi:hypothetical protein